MRVPASYTRALRKRISVHVSALAHIARSPKATPDSIVIHHLCALAKLRAEVARRRAGLVSRPLACEEKPPVNFHLEATHARSMLESGMRGLVNVEEC